MASLDVDCLRLIFSYLPTQVWRCFTLAKKAFAADPSWAASFVSTIDFLSYSQEHFVNLLVARQQKLPFKRIKLAVNIPSMADLLQLCPDLESLDFVTSGARVLGQIPAQWDFTRLWKRISFREVKFEDALMRQLKTLTPRLPSLRELAFTGCSDFSYTGLVDGVMKATGLETLALEDHPKLGLIGYLVLTKLSAHPSLRTLSLKDSCISDPLFVNSVMRLRNLTRLSFKQSSRLPYVGLTVGSVGRVLETPSGLKELILSGAKSDQFPFLANPFTPLPLSEQECQLTKLCLADCLGTQPNYNISDRLADYLSKTKVLQHLDLRGKGVLVASKLARALQQNSTLQVLKLPSTYHDDHDSYQIYQVLATHPSITRLDCSPLLGEVIIVATLISTATVLKHLTIREMNFAWTESLHNPLVANKSLAIFRLVWVRPLTPEFSGQMLAHLQTLSPRLIDQTQILCRLKE